MGRKISAILSRGLFNVDKSQCPSELLSYEAQWLLAVKCTKAEGQQPYSVAIALFDMLSMQVKIGQFTDNQTLSRLRTLLSHEKPVQIVYDRAGMNKDVLICLRCSVD